jgi:hypothetical protein
LREWVCFLLPKSFCSVSRQSGSDRFQLSFSAENGNLFAAPIIATDGD